MQTRCRYAVVTIASKAKCIKLCEKIDSPPDVDRFQISDRARLRLLFWALSCTLQAVVLALTSGIEILEVSNLPVPRRTCHTLYDAGPLSPGPRVAGSGRHLVLTSANRVNSRMSAIASNARRAFIVACMTPTVDSAYAIAHPELLAAISTPNPTPETGTDIKEMPPQLNNDLALRVKQWWWSLNDDEPDHKQQGVLFYGCSISMIRMRTVHRATNFTILRVDIDERMYHKTVKTRNSADCPGGCIELGNGFISSSFSFDQQMTRTFEVRALPPAP
ncbi:uncharacterized protein BJ212DRAFT_1304906 [Suillus subaureus]|uniref:Uncharacterized protein n=1 Tax=Suillus subaureus TaxID=48587 RepID=A0A9P7DSG8_9AGAM|nr:uncharacterized protein BJ212DRAFT_1304906 [Suillus subaureus]KAG1801984.1 hypothetical protein BJ212DRAFT_1304906 [Suillus subaureus]